MAYSEDNFPSAGQWEDQAYNSYKQWPTDVNPAQVTVTQNRPAFSNYSHNGRKFTRRVSYAKWQLEVVYPPVNDAQFTKMHAIALAAQGQYNPFEFDIDYLFQYNSAATSTLTLTSAVSVGDQSIDVSGLPVSTTAAVKKGEIIEIPNRNGAVNLVLADTDSDSSGNATLRIAYPATETVADTTVLDRKLQQVVVTLAENGFQYNLDENGFYLVSVSFDLDEWK